MTTVPNQIARRGQLFIIPVGPAIAEVPYPIQSFTKPKDHSLWVHGKIEEPEFQLDRAIMPPSVYREVRDDLNKFSPVPVSRSAIRKSNHAYVGVIDSNGTPYYFALDSRGISVREVAGDEVWKTFDALIDAERTEALHRRRVEATEEMKAVDRELRDPKLVIMTKGIGGFIRLLRPNREPKQPKVKQPRAPRAPRAPKEPKVKQAKPPKEIKFRTSESGKQHRATAPHGSYKIKQTKGQHHLIYQPHLDHAAKEGAAGTRQHLGAFDSPHGAATAAAAHHAEQVKKSMDVIKAHHPHVRWVAHQLRNGKMVNHESGTHAYRVHRPETGTTHYVVISHRGVKSHHDTPEEAAVAAHVHTKVSKARKRLPGGHVRDPDDFDAKQLRIGAKHEHEHTSDDDIASEIAMDHLSEDPDYYTKLKQVEKALPKKSKDKPVKKTPSSKASKKQTGKTGKPRYTYPQEKGGAKTAQQPLIPIQHDDSKHANPSEFANQLGVSVRTLQRAAKHLGRDGFTKFMRSRLKRFSVKHRIDPDYWGTLYEKLNVNVGGDQPA